MSSENLNWDKEIEEIHQRRALAKGHGGEEAVEEHHAKGRMTLRERIDRLIDAGSFKESGMGAGGAEKDERGNLTGFTPSNFILGFAKVDKRPIIIGGEDFTIRGGSPTVAGLRKSVYTEQLACKYKLPLVRLHEGGGGSVVTYT